MMCSKQNPPVIARATGRRLGLNQRERYIYIYRQRALALALALFLALSPSLSLSELLSFSLSLALALTLLLLHLSTFSLFWSHSRSGSLSISRCPFCSGFRFRYCLLSGSRACVGTLGHDPHVVGGVVVSIGIVVC